jgi:hypothetical protein
LTTEPTHAARALLRQLDAAGVLVALDETGALRLRPRERLTPELRAAVVERKDDLRQLLRANGAEVPSAPNWRFRLAQVVALASSLLPGGWPRDLQAHLRTLDPLLAQRLTIAEALVDHTADALAAGTALELAMEQAIAFYEQTLVDIAVELAR